MQITVNNNKHFSPAADLAIRVAMANVIQPQRNHEGDITYTTTISLRDDALTIVHVYIDGDKYVNVYRAHDDEARQLFAEAILVAV